jgi:DNA excision repair protein ERCC-2
MRLKVAVYRCVCDKIRVMFVDCVIFDRGESLSPLLIAFVFYMIPQNVLNPDVLNEAVPGNIRRAEHFIGFMKKVVEHLKARLRAVSGPTGGVRSETPLAFLHRMTNGTSLEAKPLKFAYTRLASLLRTLQVSNLDDYNALTDVADFASLLATYSEGMAKFAIIMEPNGSNSVPGASDPVIQLACLDASLAIAPLFKRFGSVIITSGTLSPIDLYPKLLQFEPCVSESLSMSTFRPCIRPLMISRGSDQLAVSTRFEDRGDMGVVRNYGAMLVELCSVIPDGVVAFFTSYSYMESLISEWDAIGILRELTKWKLVFIETKDVVETTLALDNYRRACDCGRGAVFLSVARGKVSEGINFDRHYGRAVIMFGVPYQYTLSHVLRARLEYLHTNLQIREQDFLNFDAIRQVAQCVGRVIRSKTDYGLMIFADIRFNRHDKRSKLPKWILQFMQDACLNLSTDTAIAHVKSFLRLMGQPIDQEALQSVLLTFDEVNRMNPNRMIRQVAGDGGAMITESTTMS